MKKLLLAGLTFLTISLAWFSLSYKSMKPIDTLTHNEAIVRLEMFVGGGRGGCTGTVISDELVLTAAHCMVGPFGTILNYTITQNGDLTHTIQGIFYGASPENDIGLIRGDFSSFKKLPIDTVNMRLLGTGPFISCGFAALQTELTCVELRYIEPFGFEYVAYGQLVRGMSGGPVFDLSLGFPIIVAVNTAIWPGLHTRREPGAIISPIVGLRGWLDLRGL